jgi:hypothetical protein
MAVAVAVALLHEYTYITVDSDRSPQDEHACGWCARVILVQYSCAAPASSVRALHCTRRLMIPSQSYTTCTVYCSSTSSPPDMTHCHLSPPPEDRSPTA